jgi:hypothetical protein
MDWFIALIAALALATQFAGWMVWRNLMVWMPVTARMTGNDYREAERHFDGIGASMLMENNNESGRLTMCWYAYDDEAGVRHTTQFFTLVERGFAPDAAITVWYDPENPERVTRIGPFAWLLVMVTLAAATGYLIANGAEGLALIVWPREA